MISKKLYILRHEQREDSISFNSQLTVNGIYNSFTQVCKKLGDNIDVIYCSPFIRTIQTIERYATTHNIKINLEWSLAESVPKQYHIPSKYENMINREYLSYLSYNDAISYSDEEKILQFDVIKNNIRNFLNNIRQNDQNVLLVTHLPIINAILSVMGYERKDGEEIKMFNQHPYGILICIDF